MSAMTAKDLIDEARAQRDSAKRCTQELATQIWEAFEARHKANGGGDLMAWCNHITSDRRNTPEWLIKLARALHAANMNRTRTATDRQGE